MSSADDIEITFSPLYAWMLIGFGLFFFLLGLFVMTPWAVGGSVALGVLIALAAAAGMGGGVLWLKHLPVVLRFTSEELQVIGSAPVRWSEIERVDVQKIDMEGHLVSYVCIELKTRRAVEGNLNRAFQAARSAVLGDYDIVLDEQKYSRPAEWLAAECKRRVGQSLISRRRFRRGQREFLCACPHAVCFHH